MQGEKVSGSKRTNEMSVGMNEVHLPRKKGGSTICTAGSVRESRGTRQSAVGPTERAMRQQVQIAKFHWEIADGIANPLPKQGWFRRHFSSFRSQPLCHCQFWGDCQYVQAGGLRGSCREEHFCLFCIWPVWVSVFGELLTQKVWEYQVARLRN